MTPIDFGSLAPCRTCNGTGKSRNPDWGDKDAARERARARRRNPDLPHATEVVACVECGGVGYIPPVKADAERLIREDQRASIAGRRP